MCTVLSQVLIVWIPLCQVPTCVFIVSTDNHQRFICRDATTWIRFLSVGHLMETWSWLTLSLHYFHTVTQIWPWVFDSTVSVKLKLPPAKNYCKDFKINWCKTRKEQIRCWSRSAGIYFITFLNTSRVFFFLGGGGGIHQFPREQLMDLDENNQAIVGN